MPLCSPAPGRTPTRPTPTPQDLHHPAMRDRHWKMLMQATGTQFVMDARFCLGELLALELHNFVDACSEIVDRCARTEGAWGAAPLWMTTLRSTSCGVAERSPGQASSPCAVLPHARPLPQGTEGAQHREAAQAH